jgi:hypothetical protein
MRNERWLKSEPQHGPKERREAYRGDQGGVEVDEECRRRSRGCRIRILAARAGERTAVRAKVSLIEVEMDKGSTLADDASLRGALALMLARRITHGSGGWAVGALTTRSVGSAVYASRENPVWKN